MSSRSLGTLTLDIVAKIGGYQAGLQAAEKEAIKRAKAIEKVFDQAAKGIGIAFGAIAASGAAAFAAFDQLVKQAGDFQDLAEKTGASAEALASFSVAAKVGGASMDEIAGASQRLTKSLVGVDDESKAAGAAISALGLDLKEFKTLAPEDQLTEVAKALQGVANEGDKVAIAMALFGKAGANLLPFLKELGGGIGRVNVLTAEQIRLADDYADKQALLQGQLNLYAQAIAVQLLPAYNSLVGAFVDAAKGLTDMDQAAKNLNQSGSIQAWGESAAKAVAFIVDAVDGVTRSVQIFGKALAGQLAVATQLATLNFRGALSAGRESASDISDILDRPTFGSQLQQRLDAQRAAEQLRRQEDRGFTPRTAASAFSGASKAAKATKKDTDDAANALAQYVKTLQSSIDKTEELTEVEKAGQFLKGLGKAGEIPQVQELVMNLAKRVDAEKELNETIKLRRELSIAEGEAVNAANEKREAQIKGLLSATPSAQLEKQREDVRLLTEEFEAGRLSEESYIEAVSTRLDLSAEKLEKNKTLAEELGLSFTSAFEDAIVGGKGFSEVLKGLEQDILRIVTRKLATEPLGNALTGALGGSGGIGGFFSNIASGAGGFFKSLLGFDGGGYTGSGARAGGLDGKGGFPAMLHPNETVIDHSKGQMAGAITIQINMPPNSSRATALQTGNAVNEALQRAQRNA